MHIETIPLSNDQIISLLESDCIAGTMVLYDRYVEPLLLAIFRIVPDKEATEAILIKTLVLASKTYTGDSQQKEKLLSWVMAIARQQANLFKAENCAAIRDVAEVAKIAI